MEESICMDFEIRIENVTMRVDLILLKLNELDVIMGMDFLTKYHAILDCSNKEVVLKKPRKFEIKFVDKKKAELVNIISMFKARKLIKKGHTAYLACVVNIQETRRKPRIMPIVCEYLDVFPEEISGLPSRREIE